MTSTDKRIQYTPDTLFSTFSAVWPHLGARGVRVLVDAVTFRYMREEEVYGVFLGWKGVPVVVTDRAAYIQWPDNEETVSIQDATDEARRWGLDITDEGAIFFRNAQGLLDHWSRPLGVEL